MIGKTPHYEARQRPRQLLIGAAIAAGVCMAPAAAAPPVTAFGTVTGLGPEARLVTEDELGEMRGKFIEPESVRFFGIQLSSAWQTADGSVLTATLEFESSFNHGQPDPNTVSAAAEWNHACTGSCDPSVEIPNAPQDVTVVFGAIGATGLTTVNGAVQSTQVSGHNNSVGNVMQVRIGDYNAASVGPPDADAVALTASKSVRFDDNFVVKFQLTQNTVGLELRGPGPQQKADGLATQGVSGQPGVNQFDQHIALVGDANTIRNSLDVFVGIDPLQATQLQIENALSFMKGLGF
jgi:hypothetical protein